MCPQFAKPPFFQRKDRIRACLDTRIPLLVVAECQTREAFDAKGLDPSQFARESIRLREVPHARSQPEDR